MRRCSKCGDAKSAADFGRSVGRRDGLHSHCRACRREYHRQRSQDPAFRERKRAYIAAKRKDPKFRERQREYQAARLYGISITEAKRLYSLTQCECCGCRLPESTHHRHIDHCHDSGRVRGMICRDCNHTMRGPAQECMARMEACLAYLRRHTE